MTFMTVAGVVMMVSASLAPERPGVPPRDPWTCPSSHPIKNYASASGGYVYYLPDHPFYEEASPERCYASQEEAQRDGSRPAGGGSRRTTPSAALRAPASG